MLNSSPPGSSRALRELQPQWLSATGQPGVKDSPEGRLSAGSTGSNIETEAASLSAVPTQPPSPSYSTALDAAVGDSLLINTIPHATQHCTASPDQPLPFTLHLMRHAHSVTNEAGADTAVFDPCLSELGHIQVRTCARSTAEELDPHLVVTSPLTRALQTADGVFSTFINFATQECVPIVVAEEAREAVGLNCIAEHRDRISSLRTRFPHFDFSPCETDDADAIAAGQTTNEPLSAVKQRGRTLLQRIFGVAGHAPLLQAAPAVDVAEDCEKAADAPSSSPRVTIISHFHLIRTLVQQLYQHHVSTRGGAAADDDSVFSAEVRAFVAPVIDRKQVAGLGKFLNNCKVVEIRGVWHSESTELPDVLRCRFL